MKFDGSKESTFGNGIWHNPKKIIDKFTLKDGIQGAIGKMVLKIKDLKECKTKP